VSGSKQKTSPKEPLHWPPPDKRRGCWLYDPDVRWTPAGKPGHIKNPPSGKVVAAIFPNWNKGILRRDFENVWEYLDSMEAGPPIDGRYPDFDETCDALCAATCDGKCKHEDIKDTCADELRDRILEPPVWNVLNQHVRRALVILAIFGQKGMRPGGYHRVDFKRIAGISSNGATDRLLDFLERFGYIEKVRRKPRYKYHIVYSYDFGRKERRMILQQLNRELTRRTCKLVLEKLQKEIPRTHRPFFIEGENYTNIDPGILVGEHPPRFMVEIIGQLSRLLVATVIDDLLEPHILQRLENDTLNNPEQDEASFMKVCELLSKLLEKCDNLTPKEAKQWEKYRSRAIAGKIQRASVILYDIPEIIELGSR